MNSTRNRIDEDKFLDHLRGEHWATYAASISEDKRLEVLIGGSGFRVTICGVEAYKGQNASDAVRAYNEDQGAQEESGNVWKGAETPFADNH